jgi:hypothetical protein
MRNREHFDAIVIGGGQDDHSTGSYLRRQGATLSSFGISLRSHY